jgi:hypothetical protein
LPPLVFCVPEQEAETDADAAEVQFGSTRMASENQRVIGMRYRLRTLLTRAAELVVLIAIIAVLWSLWDSASKQAVESARQDAARNAESREQ